MGALKNVAEAAGAIADVALETMLEGEESPSRPPEKHAFAVEEPEMNEFGRLTEWYHCGIRNTGSVCKNCGQYRRNHTVLDDSAAQLAQDQQLSISVRISRWFTLHPNARIVLGASVTLLIMVAILLFYLWDVGEL